MADRRHTSGLRARYTAIAGFTAVVLSPVPLFAAQQAEAIFFQRSAADPSGQVSDSAWQSAQPTDRFVQRDPHEGAEPSQATEFRVAYDATTLFVKVRAFDREPDKIVTYLTRRDDQSPCDWIRVFIDSYHDRRTAYEFAVNPSGVKQDRYWFNDTNRDDSWDAIWDVSVSRDEHGWTAEFRIPFSQLRFSRGQAGRVGFAVVREIGRLNEISSWPLLARSANGYVSSFGELTGLGMAASPKRLELIPYTVANSNRQSPAGNPLQQPSTLGASAGLDLRYSLSSGLMLTATVNPDFGQVEADPAVVNLSAFETFFPERRPFFVEGSGNFRFDADCYDGCSNLFYSRRIGRSPQGAGNLPSGTDIHVDSPPQTTILGAAKLTGHVGRYSIGVLHADTKEEVADVLDGPVRSRQAVEPLTGYTVARVKREFDNQSYVGVMSTATNRQTTTGLSFLPSSSYVGGVDFDWRLLRRYSLNGFVQGSRVNGTPESIDDIQEDSRHYYQRPDLTSVSLDPLRTSLGGGAAAIEMSKIGGQHVRFYSNIYERSPGFETNDLGFLRRADQRQIANWLQLRSDTPTHWFRNRTINFNQWRGWNFDGDLIGSGVNVNGGVTFQNNSDVGGGTAVSETVTDDRVARGGPAVLANGTREVWMWADTDNRRAVALNLNANAGTDRQGSFWRIAAANVTVRPTPGVMTSIGMRFNRSVADSQWVANLTDSGNHYVFGHLNQTTVSFTGRLNYTVSPTLSLQLYGEPFVSVGDYSAFKELIDGRNPVYARRYTAYAYTDNPNFNVKSFRTTNVVRWEYRPGSTLFIVWQQARENDAVPGGFRFGRDARDIFATPPHNAFLIKLAYWLNY